MADAFPSISIMIPELKQGDEVAWNNLCEKFRSGLTSKTRFLFRTSNPRKTFTPDDLVQETLLKAWKQHHTFRGKTTSQFARWILTILRNTFLDWCRGEKLEFDLATWFGLTANNSTPSAAMISFEQEAQLHACMAELSIKQQTVLALRHFEGLKFVEIAEHTGININTVAGIYRRGLTQLVSLLKERGLSSQIQI